MSRKNFRVGVLRALVERDGAFCRYCGLAATQFGWRRDVNYRLRAWVEGLQIEHVLPVARGGTNDLTNLVLACEACNRIKGVGDAPPLRASRPCEFPEEHLTNILRDDFTPWSLT